MAAIFGEGKFFWKLQILHSLDTFLGRGKYFEKLQRLHCLDTLCVENFAEIALSRTVKEIEAN